MEELHPLIDTGEGSCNKEGARLARRFLAAEKLDIIFKEYVDPVICLPAFRARRPAFKQGQRLIAGLAMAKMDTIKVAGACGPTSSTSTTASQKRSDPCLQDLGQRPRRQGGLDQHS